MKSVTRVLKNSTALSLSVLLERGVAFFLPWYVARVQGKQEWGYYSTALTFVTIAAPLGYWGLDQLLPREVARDHGRVGILLTNAGVLGAVASAIASALGYLGVHLLDYPPPVQSMINLGIMLVLIPRTESIVCEAAINGLERMEWVTAVRFPATILRVGISVLLLSRGYGVGVLFASLSVYYMLTVILYVALLLHSVPSFRLQVNRATTRTLAIQGIPFVAIIFIGEGFKHVDRLLLSKLRDTDVVGLYSAGIMPIQLMYLIAPAIMTALFPMLSRQFVTSKEQFSNLVSRLFKLLFVGVFPIMLAIVAFANPAILLVFGPEYKSSITVLQISALATLPSFLARLLYRTILASDNERLTIRVVLVSSLVSLVLNALLIPRYGLVGASIAAVFTELSGLVQNLYYVDRHVLEFAFRQALLMPGVCALPSLMVFFVLVRSSTVAAWLSSTALFIGLVFVSRTLTARDFVVLPRLFGK